MSIFFATHSPTMLSFGKEGIWTGRNFTLTPLQRYNHKITRREVKLYISSHSFFKLFLILKAFGHESMDPSHGYTTENLHQTFLKTLQGDALPSLIETMMENLQSTMLQPGILKAKPSEWQVDGIFAFCYKMMFEAGYLTLFGKELDGDKSVARQQAQKALVLNALENFKEFDKIFPALIAGLPIHVFMSAYSARENLAKTLLHENLSKRANVSDLISLRMLLNDTLSTFNELSKARTHVAILWASQANTLPATFWTLLYMIRYYQKAKNPAQ